MNIRLARYRNAEPTRRKINAHSERVGISPAAARRRLLDERTVLEYLDDETGEWIAVPTVTLQR